MFVILENSSGIRVAIDVYKRQALEQMERRKKHMRAWIARMTEDNIDQSAIEKAGEILKNGGLAAFPTETVYGLGGNALDAKASEKIYAAKGRPSDNPCLLYTSRCV